MSSHPQPPASQILWRELYKTALFEPDPASCSKTSCAPSRRLCCAPGSSLGSRETTSRRNTISMTPCTPCRL